MTWKIGASALIAMFAAVAFSSTASAQAAGCAETDACLQECEDPTDTECITPCLSSAEPEIAALYQALVDCFNNSGCDLEDDECFVAACLDELTALQETCGGDEDACEDNPGPDCCIFANDDECDEPDLCDEGTDTTDCTNFPPGPGCDEEPDNPNCCQFANDGECDEPDFCEEGTDTNDCSGVDPGPAPEPDAQPDAQPDGNPDAQPDGNPDAQPDGNPDGNPEPSVQNDDDGDSGGGTIDDGCATLPGSGSPSAALLLLIGALAFLRRRQ